MHTPALWVRPLPAAWRVHAGIESAFMSTTFEREVAMHYAQQRPGKPALVFEMQLGMIDRGAELSWCARELVDNTSHQRLMPH